MLDLNVLHRARCNLFSCLFWDFFHLFALVNNLTSWKMCTAKSVYGCSPPGMSLHHHGALLKTSQIKTSVFDESLLCKCVLNKRKQQQQKTPPPAKTLTKHQHLHWDKLYNNMSTNVLQKWIRSPLHPGEVAGLKFGLCLESLAKASVSRWNIASEFPSLK